MFTTAYYTLNSNKCCLILNMTEVKLSNSCCSLRPQSEVILLFNCEFRSVQLISQRLGIQVFVTPRLKTQMLETPRHETQILVTQVLVT